MADRFPQPNPTVASSPNALNLACRRPHRNASLGGYRLRLLVVGAKRTGKCSILPCRLLLCTSLNEPIMPHYKCGGTSHYPLPHHLFKNRCWLRSTHALLHEPVTDGKSETAVTSVVLLSHYTWRNVSLLIFT